MKKLMLVILSVLIEISGVSALSFDNYMNVAYSRDFSFESIEKEITTYNCNAVDISLTSYINSNFGIYFNANFADYSANSDEYIISHTNSFIIGPSYKYNFTEKFQIFGAVGFSWSVSEWACELTFFGMEHKVIDYGVAGDIGIRYLFKNCFYGTLGTTISHEFYGDGKNHYCGGGN